MNVLVTNAEGFSVLGMIQSLGRKGIKLFATSEYPSAIGFYSKYTCGFAVHSSLNYENFNPISTEKQEKKFLNDIKSLVEKWDIDLLIPNSENTLIPISKYRDCINSSVFLPEHENLMIICDKVKFINFCRKHKISTPRTYFPKSEDDIKKIIKIEDLPLIVKPNIGGGGTREKYLFHRPKDFILECKKLLKLGKKPLIQEYIEGNFYSSILVLDEKSNISSFFGCELSFGKRFPISKKNRKIIKICKKILRKLDWRGIASPQFIINDKGFPKTLEINPRILGGITDLALMCGVDIPYILYKVFLGRKLYPKAYKEGITYMLPHQIFYFLQQIGLKSTLSHIYKRKMTIGGMLTEDPLPIMSLYYSSMRKRLTSLFM
ncbi:MAG: ATP-grasp domain-containing protein [Candidatus Aenigmarchaeota archaeon]|nr:ATP-grasp domain-containing protein [Candidatus Aenigmarchaeota archaeon]